MSRNLRVAIIGAGPAGFYAAEGLIKNLENVSVDIIEALPTPYGLVRYGIAPDHQKIKSVSRLYERTAADPRVNLLANVNFGTDINLAEINKHYDAVVFTTGASSDRSLGIKGEDLAGSISATNFVAWYNGLPAYKDFISSLDAKAVAVIGVGNVAVDVVRILAKSVDELATTDIADHSLEVLKESQVKDIYMIGRRGPAQAKYTTKELRELGELVNADIFVDKEDLVLDEESQKVAENDRAISKQLTELANYAQRKPEGKARRVHIKFLASPTEIKGESKVEAIVLEKNRLEPTPSGYINAVGTGQFETLPVDMVLRSVGYRGVKLPDISFDEKRGIIPNADGRVLTE
ncbi:MAG TPA: NADP oxidoreductase, partial [Trueperaceae bacterium]|nr:NADP oxidoreductase [Trueperaceae bacterium]